MSHCCEHKQHKNKLTIDWLLWGSACFIGLAYGTHVFIGESINVTLASFNLAVFELTNTMWWGMLMAAVFVGVLGRIPRPFVTAIIGKGGSWSGLLRACIAGVLLDLCSHGILMVGMQLYRSGASLGQTMAFLIASPWNSLSLTIILFALIGLPWTLLFIVLSMVIALITGRIFDCLVTQGVLPVNPAQPASPNNFKFWQTAKTAVSNIDFSLKLIFTVLWEGVKASRMVLRWLLFGILVASAIRGFVAADTYQAMFGPTLAGLGLTLIAATLIEVCSEGSTPIAADLLIRANAPGNSFAFLMTGVSTDYTEILSIRDTMQSWKIALLLPLISVPQIVVIAYLLNT